MATRLLSFLADIERALHRDSASKPRPAWECQRMVNYKDGLARMILVAPAHDASQGGGTIFLQSFRLADGSICVKAGLGWDGSAAESLVAVYAKPGLDWAAEARRIADTWLAGPPAAATIIADSAPEMGQLKAVAS